MNFEQTIGGPRAGNSRGSPFWPSRTPSGCDQFPKLVRYFGAGNENRDRIARLDDGRCSVSRGCRGRDSIHLKVRKSL